MSLIMMLDFKLSANNYRSSVPPPFKSAKSLINIHLFIKYAPANCHCLHSAGSSGK